MEAHEQLETRIVDALTKPCDLATLDQVEKDARVRLRALTAEDERLENESLSPLLSSAEANAIRQQSQDAKFASDRMDASLSALRARREEIEAQQQKERRAVEIKNAIAERDKLAKDIADQYPKIVRDLTDLVRRINENDAWLAGVNDYSGSAEAMGRGIPLTFYKGPQPCKRLASLHLPMPEGTRRAWEFTSSGWKYPGLDVA